MAAFSLGYTFSVPAVAQLVPAIRVVGNLNVIGSELGRVYETQTPTGGMVFVQLRPEEITKQGMEGDAMPMGAGTAMPNDLP